METPERRARRLSALEEVTIAGWERRRSDREAELEAAIHDAEGIEPERVERFLREYARPTDA